VCGLADMYYSSPNTLVPNYETTRHIQKKDSNPGTEYFLGFGNTFDWYHRVVFGINKQAFQFFSLTQLYNYYLLATCFGSYLDDHQDTV
jgi:hypothetical protein